MSMLQSLSGRRRSKTKRRRRSRGRGAAKPPTYPRGRRGRGGRRSRTRGNKNVVSIPWNMIPNDISSTSFVCLCSRLTHECRNNNNNTGTLKSAGTPTAKRKMLPSDDEEDDFDDRLSEDDEEEDDIEEWGGRLSIFHFLLFSFFFNIQNLQTGTPTTPSMSRSRTSYVPTSRGGFVISENSATKGGAGVGVTPSAVIESADDAASILAMLNTPRIN